MFFRQLLHEDHEHVCAATYVVASDGAGLVVDPVWEVDDVLALARAYHFTIRHVVETHLHGDHVSGARRIAAATGAQIHVPSGAGVRFAHEPLGPGGAIDVGHLRATAIAAPGHRPEHLALAVSARERWHDPWLLLTGDSLAVGGIALPDWDVDPRAGAIELFHTLRRLRRFDDSVEVWPGHVAGPLGGLGSMSQKTSSTLGAERRWNELVSMQDEDDFATRALLRARPHWPSAPAVSAVNRGLAPLPDAAPAAVSAGELRRLLDDGALLVDGRTPARFDAAHVPGSVNLPLEGRSVGMRAAALIPPETPLVVVAQAYRDAARLVSLLQTAGLCDTRGILVGGVASWSAVPLETSSARSLAPADLGNELGSGRVTLVDVREEEEWRAGHVPGSLHVPLVEVTNGAAERLPRGPLAVVCQVGNRAALAASVLRRRGFDDVRRVSAGISDLQTHGIPLERG